MGEIKNKKQLILTISIILSILVLIIVVPYSIFTYFKEKAYDASYQQEKDMQMEIDITKDLKDPNYLTWEEFENAINQNLDIKDKKVIIKNISIVLDEYVVKNNNGLTGLTKEQVQKIIIKKVKDNNIKLLSEIELVDIINKIIDSEEQLDFKLNEDGVSYSVIGIGNCTQKELYIPGEYNKLPVTKINDLAFYRSNLITVTISSNIKEIGEYSFAESALETIIFGKNSSLETIGKGAFERSKIKNIEIPNGVRVLESETFNYCENLEYIKIPINLSTIKSYAFYHCQNLKTIEIRKSVDKIEKHAFAFCLSLEIYCEADLIPEGWDKEWNSSNSNVIWGHEMELEIHEHIESDWEVIEEPTCTKTGLKEKHCKICDELIETAIIEKSSHLLVIDPGEKASCFNPGLTEGSHCKVCFEIIVKQEVIPQYAHLEGEYGVIREATCKVEGLMGTKCIRCDCIIISEMIDKIDHTPEVMEAVEPTCSETGLTEGVRCKNCSAIIVEQKIIDTLPHEETRWTVTKEATCKELGVKTERCTKCLKVVKTEDIPKKPHNFINGKCISCDLLESSKELSFTLTKDGKGYAVSIGVCKDTNIIIPNEFQDLPVVEIAYKGFTGSQIVSIKLPDTITLIGDSAFEGCTSLKSITIPSSVKRIGYYAFKSCTSLENIEIPYNVDTLCQEAFQNCTNLKTAILKMKCTWIDYNLFNGCSNLTTVELPENIKNIEYMAFADCKSLKNIKIPKTVTQIFGHAFKGCTSLDNIIIPSSVTYLGDWIFDDCSNLKELTIDKVPSKGLLSLGKILQNTLEKLTITGNYDIEENAFYNYQNLQEVTIKGFIRIIGDKAFAECKSLTKVFIRSTVVYMGTSVFAGCDNLTIYSESESLPDTWTNNWNPDNRPIVWKYVI